ncbi:MAG: hypothetical protein JWM74_179 [Myxococcaceae bacterium]|nr:hypothetical protein [Myxococcaceae bacterium]
MGKSSISLALKAEGIESVRDAIRTVQHSFIELDQQSIASTDAASKKRIAILRGEAKIKLALLREEEGAKVRSAREFRNATGSSSGVGQIAEAVAGGQSYKDIMKAAGASGVAFGIFNAAVNFASASLKQFASFVVNDVIKPSLALQTRSQQVANNSGGALTAGGVMSRARGIGLRNNMDAQSILNATGRFQDLTGEPAMGFEIMPTVAAISKGRGYDPMALTELSAATYRPGMKGKDMNQLLLSLTAQGEKGSIPIGELARLGGRLTAPAEKLGGDYFTKFTTASALVQTAKRTGFGTVDEAAEGFNKFVQEAPLHGKSLSPKSFAAVNGVDTILDPVRYLGDIFRKTRGSGTALHALGFSDPGQKFVSAYTGTFSAGYTEAKAAGKNETQARDAGATAVENLVNSMKTQTSSMEAEEARRDSVTRTAGEKFAIGLATIQGGIADKMMPSVEKLADAFIEHTDEIVRTAVLLASILGDVAEAGLSVVEFFDQFKTHGEGDVLKRVVDKGAATVLPHMGDEKGYWLHDKGMYSFVKGAADQAVDDVANKGLRPMAGGLPSERRSKWGVYERETGSGPVDASKLISLASNPGQPIQNSTFQNSSSEEPFASEDTTTPYPEPTGAAGDDATSEMATAHKEAAENADKLKTACDGLATCIEDLTSKFDGLNRNASFMER